MDQNYSAMKTTKKAGATLTTVSAVGIVSIVLAAKLQPILSANGVEIDNSVLIVGITSALQSGYAALKNWLKNRKKV